VYIPDVLGVLIAMLEHAVGYYLRHYVASRKVTGLIPDEVIRFFNSPNPSSRSMALRSTQPPTEMSTRNLPGGKGQPARKAGDLIADRLSRNGASTSHNPMCLHSLLRGWLYLLM
jgi:hypothetical protein